jgi:hypothetical protein
VAAAGDELAGNPGPKAQTGGESISFASVLTGLLGHGTVPDGNVPAALVAACLVDRTPTVPENPDAAGVAAAPPVFVPVQPGADPENVVKADGEGASHGIASGVLEQPVPPWFGGWELPAPILGPVSPDLCAPGGPEALGQPAGTVAVTEAATASYARIKAPVVLRAVYTWGSMTVPPGETGTGIAAASAGMPGHNMSRPDPVAVPEPAMLGVEAVLPPVTRPSGTAAGGETGSNQDAPAPSAGVFLVLPPEAEGDQPVPLLLRAAVQSRNGQGQVTVPVQTAAANQEGAGRADVPSANPGSGLLEAGQQTGAGNRVVAHAAPPLPETMPQSDGGNPVPKMLNQGCPSANGSGVAQGFFTPAAPGRAGETPAAEVFSGGERMHSAVQSAERVFEPPAAETSQAVWLSGQTGRVPLEDLPRQLAPEIVRRITAFSGRQGVVRVELRLDPPELGSVGVRLLFTGDELKAHFFTADAAVKEILVATLPELKTDLGRAGFHLGEAFVSVGQEQNEESQPPPRWGGTFRVSGGAGRAVEVTSLAEGVNFLV